MSANASRGMSGWRTRVGHALFRRAFREGIGGSGRRVLKLDARVPMN